MKKFPSNKPTRNKYLIFADVSLLLSFSLYYIVRIIFEPVKYQLRAQNTPRAVPLYFLTTRNYKEINKLSSRERKISGDEASLSTRRKFCYILPARAVSFPTGQEILPLRIQIFSGLLLSRASTEAGNTMPEIG